MKKYKTRQAKALVDICCDVCDKSCKTPLDDYEVATLSAQWGYHSRKDGESYHVDLCEDCFDEVVTYVNKMRK
jgi:hypothetical protein